MGEGGGYYLIEFERLSESRRENLFLSISAVGVGACQRDVELDVALIVTNTKKEEDHLGSSQGLLFGYRRRSLSDPPSESKGVPRAGAQQGRARRGRAKRHITSRHAKARIEGRAGGSHGNSFLINRPA